MTAQLHCFGESGHSCKVAPMMRLTGYPWRPVFADFFDGGTRGTDHRPLNDMAEAPVLDENGLTLSHSCVILLLFAETTGCNMDADRDEILRGLFWSNHEGPSRFDTPRFLMCFLLPEKRPAKVIGWLQRCCRVAQKRPGTRLAGRDWLAGRQPTIADLGCCGHLIYPADFGFDRADWPHIDAWLARIQSLLGWKRPYDLMPGRPANRAAKEDA